MHSEDIMKHIVLTGMGIARSRNTEYCYDSSIERTRITLIMVPITELKKN